MRKLLISIFAIVAITPPALIVVAFVAGHFGGCDINSAIGARCSGFGQTMESFVGDTFMLGLAGCFTASPIGGLLCALFSSINKETKTTKEAKLEKPAGQWNE